MNNNNSINTNDIVRDTPNNYLKLFEPVTPLKSYDSQSSDETLTASEREDSDWQIDQKRSAKNHNKKNSSETSKKKTHSKE